MSDWEDRLTPEEYVNWQDFVDHVRRDAMEKIAGSEVFLSLLTPGETDVKFAVELGLAIMFDKPIITVALAGRTMPEHLRRVSDYIVEGDPDTEEGRQRLQEVLKTVFAEFTEGDDG